MQLIAELTTVLIFPLIFAAPVKHETSAAAMNANITATISNVTVTHRLSRDDGRTTLPPYMADFTQGVDYLTTCEDLGATDRTDTGQAIKNLAGFCRAGYGAPLVQEFTARSNAFMCSWGGEQTCSAAEYGALLALGRADECLDSGGAWTVRVLKWKKAFGVVPLGVNPLEMEACTKS